MSTLEIAGLRAAVDGNEILRGVDLTVNSGEVHGVMGPNGSGKSTLAAVVMGRPGYTVTGGSITLDGVELTELSPFERARAGLFLALQHPIEVPGVALRDVLEAAAVARGADPELVGAAMVAEAERIGFGAAFLDRALNVDLSGGEKKRNETLQMSVLEPKIAVLDEIDSGLDVDALRMVSRRVEAATTENDLGVLAITHFRRLFDELDPDRVHIFANGRIMASGGRELVEEVEADGYSRWVDARSETTVTLGGLGGGSAAEDPFADPFADPLA